jgi:hypothetical protein
VLVRGLEERVELGHRHGRIAPGFPAEVVDAGLAHDQAEPVGRGLQHLVLGEDPLGAELGDLAVLELERKHSATHAVSRLEHGHRETRVVEVERGRQPCEAGPDHRDVYPVGHRPHDRSVCVG